MTKKEKYIFKKAIEACKAIDKFTSECMTGHPIQFISNGKLINHRLLNEAYDLSYEVLSKLKEDQNG